MILSEIEYETFEAAARPLIKWLCENCHPHVTVIVQSDSAEITEGVCRIIVEDYIGD